MQKTLQVLLACLFLFGCSPRQTSSTSTKGSVQQGETVTYSGGTTMHVEERTGDSLRRIHIVHRTPEGALATVDAEKGLISQGMDSQVVRVTLYDASVRQGAGVLYSVGELTINLVKELDTDSLKRIARDVRLQRLTNQTQQTGR